MRDLVAAHFANAPAPQAPARNDPNDHVRRSPPTSLDTFNSHRKIKRPKLIGDKKVYRPVRLNTLSRIDETPQTPRPRSKSLQHSSDFYSTRPVMRSRSNVSADTSRSVPVCDQSQSQELEMPAESNSPQYAEPKGSDSSYDDRPASMTDLPIVVPVDPATGAYIPYPEYSYYRDDGCRLNHFRKYNKKMKKLSSKHNNVYLAFMY